MKLVSMKRSKKERKKSEDDCMPSSGDDYHYGLRINLDTDGLDKLGLKSLPTVGKKFRLHAECEVVSTGTNERNGKATRDMSLQIQKLGISSAPQSGLDALEDGLEAAKDA